jgi:hypothetical protein
LEETDVLQPAKAAINVVKSNLSKQNTQQINDNLTFQNTHQSLYFV